MSRPRLHKDYEAFSTVDLLAAGSDNYARKAFPILLGLKVDSDDTEVHDYSEYFNAGYDDFGDYDGEPLPVPYVWEEACRDNWIIVAHNAPFEMDMISRSPALAHWPKPKLEQWVCTAAKARYHGLPNSLAGVGAALRLEVQKDKRGDQLIGKFCKPKKTHHRKGASTYIPTIDSASEDWLAFKQYNYIDVETEYGVDMALPDIPEKYARIWRLDRAMNMRGFPVDIEGVRRARVYYQHFYAELEARFKAICGGLAPSQVAKCREYLNEHYQTGLADLQAPTIRDRLLEDDLHPDAREALAIRAEAAKASVKKLEAFMDRTGPDGRARGGFLWYGAHTGRWCLTGDHEVLTRRGWVRLDEWQGGSIACWNKNEEISFQKAKANSFDATGVDMVHIQTNRVDQLSTDEHRMPGWSAHTGEFQVKEAGALGRFCIPYTGVKSSGSVLDENALRVIVMVQADGHYATDGQIKLKFNKHRKVVRCKTLLRRAGITFDIKVQNDGNTLFQIRRRHMPLYLRMFELKTFGWWLLDCDHKVLFNELEHWDAYRAGPNSIQYTTTNKLNAEIIQTCAHVSGLAALMGSKPAREGWSEIYTLSIWLTASNRHEIRDKPKIAIHDGAVYCPTTPTGFFLVRRNNKIWVTGNSGRGIQPQNFPRGDKAALRLLPAFFAWLDTPEGAPTRADLETAGLVYPSPLTVLSAALRGFIRAEPGKLFVVVDYAQIELRVLAWLAGETELLDQLREGLDPYIQFAAKHMYNCAPGEVTPLMRQIAKSALLGAQYQIWIWAFIEYCKTTANLKISIEEATNAILSYRNANPNIVDFWADIERAAILAVEGRVETKLNCLRFRYESCDGRNWLRIYLPNGRPISYFDPLVSLRVTEHEKKDREGNVVLDENGVPVTFTKRRKVLSFMTEFAGRWMREYTYGGKLTENVTQGVAAEIMGEGMRVAKLEGFLPIATVHDENVTEIDDPGTEMERQGALEHLEQLVCQLPDCYEGLPIAAEGFYCFRYRKG